MKIRTNEVPARNLDYLTVNREYEIIGFMAHPKYGGCGHIVSDNGVELLVLLKSCAFLDQRDWEVVPE